MENQIRAELTEFIVTNYLFGDVARTPRDDDALVEEGIIDSTGILELIEFLEFTSGSRCPKPRPCRRTSAAFPASPSSS